MILRPYKKIKELQKANAELADALNSAILMCGASNSGAWENGITDEYGTIDQGEVMAMQTIDRLEEVLEKHAGIFSRAQIQEAIRRKEN